MGKASIEKQNRLLDQQRVELQRKCEKANLTLIDYDGAKKKTVVENAELLNSIEELENNNAVLSKVNQTLTCQLNEQTKIAEDESKERTFLLGKYKNLEHEVDLTKGQLDEETQSKADALRLLSNQLVMLKCGVRSMKKMGWLNVRTLSQLN